MRNRPEIPEHAIVITRYAELVEFIRAFAAGYLNLLIVISLPGRGKTRLFRALLGPHSCWIAGHATAFGMYRKLWQHRDELVVIDDVDRLYRDPAGQRLLKCLCQTDRRKLVSWETKSDLLRRERIPPEFWTDSHVALLGNEWRTLNQNVAAIEDRGVIIYFDPPPPEVHAYAASWFRDQEIFDFVGERLSLFTDLSCRTYSGGLEFKRAALDWRDIVLRRALRGRALILAQIKLDPRYDTEEDRVRAFQAEGGGSRATYFRLARRLEIYPPLRIKLGAPGPLGPTQPDDDISDDDLNDFLDEQQSA